MNDHEFLLSVIVIGLNEGTRLKSCLESTLSMDFPKDKYEVIFVDSGSTDDSVEIAQQYPIQVIKTHPSKPTAARARNEGAKVGRGNYFLFLDGDTILDSDFVKTALPHFSDPKIAVICGKRQETNLQGSLYHQILNIDWNYPPGLIASCGGDAIFRRTAFEEVSGFDSELQAGEEPDLCRRLRGSGWKILGLDIPMTSHDLNMHQFNQYWKRSIRSGYAYAEVSARYAMTDDPLWKKESDHNIVKIVSYIVLILLTLMAVLKWGAVYMMILPLVLGIFITKTTISTYKKTDDFPLSICYGIHSHFQHIPLFIGQLKYWSKIKTISSYKS